MAVAIRLKRMGRKKKPFYRMIVVDERNPRQGRFIDDLGYYSPMQDPAQTQINEEKALMWLKDGAKPSDTVRNLLSKAGIMKKLHEQMNPAHQGGDDTETTEQPQKEE